jgi:predicted ArsR family transcriptional regulator
MVNGNTIITVFTANIGKIKPSPYIEAMTPLDWSQRFRESTRGRIVARLRRGLATVEELAQSVGLTENGIRVHLATLERDGWIRSEGVRRAEGPGKPATLYRLAPEAEPLLSSAYRPMLLALLGVLYDREKPAKLRTLLHETGRRLGTELAHAGGPGLRTADRVVAILGALGAEVEVEEETRDRLVVRGFGCPVGDAVRVSPSACSAVTALLEGALDAKVIERCDRSGSPHCCFEVSRRTG